MKRLLLILAFMFLVQCGSEDHAGGTGMETPNALSLRLLDSLGKPAVSARVRVLGINSDGKTVAMEFIADTMGAMVWDSIALLQIKDSLGLPPWIVMAIWNEQSVVIRLESGFDSLLGASFTDTLSAATTIQGELVDSLVVQEGSRIGIPELDLWVVPAANGTWELPAIPDGEWTLVWESAQSEPKVIETLGDQQLQLDSLDLGAWPPAVDVVPVDTVPEEPSIPDTISSTPVSVAFTDTIWLAGSSLLDPGDPKVRQFPWHLSLKDSALFARLGALGEGLRLIDIQGNPMAFHIASWNEVNREASLWVLLDSLGPTDSVRIVLHQSNSGKMLGNLPDAIFNPAWGYRGVWLLDQDPATTFENSPIVRNATGNTQFDCYRHGSKGGLASRTGLAGPALDFSGYGDLLRCGDLRLGDSLAGDSLATVTIWVYQDSLGDSVYFLSKYHPQQDEYEYRMHTYDQNQASFCWNNRNAWGPNPGAVGKWRLYAGVRDADSTRLYIDGQLIRANKAFHIGNYLAGTELGLGGQLDSEIGMFNGALDAVMVQNVARPPHWIRAHYRNLTNPALLINH